MKAKEYNLIAKCVENGVMTGWARALCDEHAKEAGYEVEENLP
jgi:hypothetical protein